MSDLIPFKEIDVSSNDEKNEPEDGHTRNELLQMIANANADDTDAFIKINKLIATSNTSSIEVGQLHKTIKKKSGITLSDLKKDYNDHLTDGSDENLTRMKYMSHT